MPSTMAQDASRLRKMGVTSFLVFVVSPLSFRGAFLETLGSQTRLWPLVGFFMVAEPLKAAVGLGHCHGS